MRENTVHGNIKNTFPLKHNSFWSLLLDSAKGQTIYDGLDSENIFFIAEYGLEMRATNLTMEAI